MGRIIAIANQKGGVGKTTTAINLSSCLAIAEKKVLLIDIDPQANASSGLGLRLDEDSQSVYELLLDDIQVEEVIFETNVPFLDIVPSHIRLVGSEIELIIQINREHLLKSKLVKIKDDYEYIFIDCPPSLGLLTINALSAADTVLIPIQCEYYALEGLSQLLNTIHLVQKNINKNLTIEGVLLTMYDNRLNLSQQVSEEVREYFKEKVYETAIRRNVRLGEAPSFGKPIIMYDAVSIGAQNYISLAEEIMNNEKETTR
ncbi:MAG: ParA family protein [Calditrichales bacterium]|nr:MAG: ParA family protein [Calditrichales bacterium]